ncbi:MAG: AmmeMemoRadiSam system radical SAM enzyme [Proteobacteria bacterium]|nr:AmmeMemoRadiSam system radical SAM enzyme [Pseudomonadota bacterium]
MSAALLFDRREDNKVRCRLCRHGCLIKDGQTGICHVRKNVGGELQSLVFRKLIAENVDPIEKKPLFHVHPGSLSYSVATVGCNFKCTFCQNADISQMPADTGRIMGRETRPEQVVAAAKRSGCRTIAHTYTEPTVYFETALEIATLATQADILTVFVSNGYMSDEALDTIHPHLAAANIDLKSFRDDFYKKQCGAKLEGVLASLQKLKRQNVWLEVTTLLIPSLNDDLAELSDLVDFLVELGPETPWHISRFFPRYHRTDLPPTSVDFLIEVRRMGLSKGLHYVYSGNIHGDESEDTNCHHCGHRLIRRRGYTVSHNVITEDKCPHCGTAVAGLGMTP